MRRLTLPYQLAMGKPQAEKPSGPLEGDALEKYLAEVDARTQLRAYEAMERHINGDGRRKVENCDGYDPFGW